MAEQRRSSTALQLASPAVMSTTPTLLSGRWAFFFGSSERFCLLSKIRHAAQENIRASFGCTLGTHSLCERMRRPMIMQASVSSREPALRARGRDCVRFPRLCFAVYAAGCDGQTKVDTLDCLAPLCCTACDNTKHTGEAAHRDTFGGLLLCAKHTSSTNTFSAISSSNHHARTRNPHRVPCSCHQQKESEAPCFRTARTRGPNIGDSASCCAPCSRLQ